jgi:Zn-dependent protease/CBS domain-containing protein
MGWSTGFGKIAGTEVRVHLTFFLFVAWIAIATALQDGPVQALDAVILILAIFACVLAHEFGHVLTAKYFGIGTRDITLLPIGGVAHIDRTPEKPSEELLIAVAGPAVNVVIAAVIIVAFGVSFSPEHLAAIMEGKFDLTTQLALVNVALVLFNLLPAFPMDGGRVLRALLSMRMQRARATRMAAAIGQIVAFGLGFLGLFGNPMLVFIAIFIFIAASHETYAIEVSEATRGVLVSQATVTALETLGSQATVGEAVRTLLSTSQREFPVTDGARRLRGVLTRDGMLRALAETGPDTPVAEVMERETPVLNQRAPLSAAMQKLQAGRHPAIVVVDDGEQVVGIITMENLAEFMLVQQASAGWRALQGGGKEPLADAK